MTENSPTGYSAEAVQQQIERDRRRHRISKKEERLIHALLNGRGGRKDCSGRRERAVPPVSRSPTKFRSDAE